MTFTDTSVFPQTAYWYRVAAYNASGNSFYSNENRVLTSIASSGDNSGSARRRCVPQRRMPTLFPPTPLSLEQPITSAEYQFIADNPPGIFDAKDIYATHDGSDSVTGV